MRKAVDGLVLLLVIAQAATGGVASRASAQRAETLGPETRKYLRVVTPRTMLTHVRVIDGTGAAPLSDRNVTIEDGRITSIDTGKDVQPAAGVTVLDGRGHTVMPGIVGMHDHVWFQTRPNLRPDNTFDGPAIRQEMAFSAPRLYLAAGVTTIRTAGSVAPYTDLWLAQNIEAGVVPGPHMDVTGPYLQGRDPSGAPQLMQLSGADDARQTVAFWADRGVTSFKAYTNITRDELRAVIEEAHRRGLKVTGHLCSVTYPEAIALGIDNLEHGFMANTANDPDKKPDTCTASAGDFTLEHMTPGSAESTALIDALVSHHVAITSTLALRASGLPGIGMQIDGRSLPSGLVDAMSPAMRADFENWRTRPSPTRSRTALLFRNEAGLERQFVAAGGLLLSGPDPVGLNGLVPGFSDHRQIELLVEAGFSPLEAIRIATLNGAMFLGRDSVIGSIAVGKRADLVFVRGDPSSRIADLENVEVVFKDGVGYDPRALFASVKGRFGDY
jgi:imidazolonepropionase-like amidohydrolase